MATMVMCDECGKSIADERVALGWFAVARLGDMQRSGDMPGPWHFCSWRCVGDYVVDLQVQPKKR